MIIQDYLPDLHFANNERATENHPILRCKVPTDQWGPSTLIPFVVFIEPKDAEELLRLNCANNRALNHSRVKSLASDMRRGTFTVSDSAICFDSHGLLSNGQHRLNAIIEAGVGQWCLVMINTDKEQGLKFDLGTSRSMSDRITFNGVRITKKECAAVRHAMADISKPTTGILQFGFPQHDAMVEKHFLKFKDYFEFLKEAKDSTQCKGLLSGCGLKIWAEMKNKPYQTFAHDMDVEARVLHWLQITHFGAPKSMSYVHEHDSAAFQIYKHSEKLKQQNIPFQDFGALRMTVSAAHKFMLGKNIRVNNEHRVERSTTFNRDPFTRLQSLNPTNPHFGDVQPSQNSIVL